MQVCWCGNSQLAGFSDNYGECRECGTLVSLSGFTPEKHVVQDDEKDFYGKQYWLDHQQEKLGLPNIFQRSRNDLTERNLHWLKALLKYRLPAVDVLELGCSHGSFVALLQQAGYHATGLELSPWVADFGRDTFNVPILVGPIETQNLLPASFDVIALMDVLEHLSDPQATLQRCLKLLKPDGVLLIQTPQFKEGMSHEGMVGDNHPFLSLLQPKEHLYLFSDRSVTECFNRLGAEYISFEPAIFDCYDMFLAVSRLPMKTNTTDEIESMLLATPSGRFALALLDMDTKIKSLQSSIEELTVYKENSIQQIQTLTSWVHEARAERDKLEQQNTDALSKPVDMAISTLPRFLYRLASKIFGRN